MRRFFIPFRQSIIRRVVQEHVVSGFNIIEGDARKSMKFLIKMWEKCKENSMKRKLLRILVVLFLAGAVCLLNSHFCYPSRIPDIVFVCTNYDEVQKEVCEITFMDKYGKCYYSDDPYVCNIYKRDLINAYKAGEIEDKIQFRGSCSRNVVIRKYRKMYRVVKKKRVSISYPGFLWPCVLTNQYDWLWLYFDGSGEVHYSVFHTKKFGHDYHSTNNKQVNRIYEWCEDIMGQMED